MAENKVILEADEIRVGPLTICKTSDGGAGIWIGDVGQPMVAIYKVDGQTAIGFFGPDVSKGMSLAFSLDQDGTPYVQYKDGDDMKMTDFSDLPNQKPAGSTVGAVPSKK